VNQKERVATAIRTRLLPEDHGPWDDEDDRSFWLETAAAAIEASKPSSESLEDKAVAVLAEGRLRVRMMRPDGLVVAHVTGRTGEYDLGYDPARREWRCTCPVPGRRPCSHLLALRLVVDEPRAPARRDDDDDEGRTDASHPG